MKGSSSVIMGTTMAMVVILAFVLALVLVLLAELYCSLLLCRRQLKATKPCQNPENPSISQAQDHQSLSSPVSSLCSQGVLDAPRSFLFPKLPSKRRNDEHEDDVEKQKHGKLHQFLRIHNPNPIGFTSSSSSPSPSHISVSKPPQPSHSHEVVEAKVGVHVHGGDEASNGEKGEALMYISNPIYDLSQASRVDTPFETPGSSPTRLDHNVSSGEEEREENKVGTQLSPPSLPLTPMKKLPAKASSVSLKDARSSLGASGSDTNSHIGRSSSSSDSPCTSPSW